MVFSASKNAWEVKNINVNLNKVKLQSVPELKYLGYIVRNNLCNAGDIKKCTNSLYGQFNSLIRKFNKLDVETFMFLFKSHCSSFYGNELWFSTKKCKKEFNQLKTSYHKCIKKIYNIPYWTSSHAICEEAGLLTFQHLNRLRK